MKHILLIILLASSGLAFSQDIDTTAHSRMALGEGMQFSLNENQYQFKFSGFIQPSYLYTKTDFVNAQNKLSSKRTYLNFSGKALKEKVSFFFQADFSAGTPLLDAYLTYHLNSSWGISAGQRRTFTNNREMTFNEDALQFSERGYTSTQFTGNGREFGAFLEGKIGDESSFMIAPQLAVTSGDGPNSFGLNSVDVDLGGLKYGGRLDIYPFGAFSKGNSGFAQDLKHEQTFKLLIGVSGSLNNGANDDKGEGHGTYTLYKSKGIKQFPDLRKIHVDILMKYRGFSAMGEYVNASGAKVQGLYTDSLGTVSIQPRQISSLLILGNAWNAQVGYVTKSGYALNARYEYINPEFGSYSANLLKKQAISTIGVSKYFRDNALKLQATYSMIKYDSKNAYQAELVMQVVF